MSEFQTYLKLGFHHISDLAGYDHILFIIALCVIYDLKSWKGLIILVTAFTIGHSLTLALSTLEIFSIKTRLIEFLIPITILITALLNIFLGLKPRDSGRMRYATALFFGLIHGLGFSNYLSGLLGRGENVVSRLFAFNVGIELGQLMIVGILLVCQILFTRIFKGKHRDWNLVLSGATGGIALTLVKQNWYF